jgi:hypothetical protein
MKEAPVVTLSRSISPPLRKGGMKYNTPASGHRRAMLNPAMATMIFAILSNAHLLA